MKPRIIVAPHFRAMDEVFDGPAFERLHSLGEVVWGRNGAISPMLICSSLPMTPVLSPG